MIGTSSLDDLRTTPQCVAEPSTELADSVACELLFFAVLAMTDYSERQSPYKASCHEEDQSGSGQILITTL